MRMGPEVGRSFGEGWGLAHPKWLVFESAEFRFQHVITNYTTVIASHCVQKRISDLWK